MKVDPNASISELKGVGPSMQATMARLGIFRLVDLLLHLPMRYQDRTRVTPISQVRAGEEALVQGQIERVEVQFGRRRSLKVVLRDDSGEVALRFFHFSRFQQNNLNNARFLRAYGEFRFFGRELSGGASRVRDLRRTTATTGTGPDTDLSDHTGSGPVPTA